MTKRLSPVLALLVLVAGCAGPGATRKAGSPAEAPVVAAASPDAPEAPPPAPPDAAAEAARELAARQRAAAAPQAPPAPAPPAAPERYVSLNFDNADVSVVIQTVAELLKLNYIVAPGVRGKVTIQTSEKLPVSSLLPVLDQILEVNSLVAVKTGGFYKIVPAGQAKQETMETIPPDAAPGAGPATGLVTRIVQLRHISPAEVVKIVTPFKTPAGVYQAHEPARLLFLTEAPAKIAELMRIVEVLDVDTFASIQVELYPVRFAGVDDLARELTQIVQMVYAAAGRGKTLFRIVPVAQVNAIMVFSGEPGLAANVREWIAKLDQPATEANERIFVYPLSHATAETLAGVLEKVFRREATKGQTAKAATPAAGVPAAPAAARQGQAAATPAAPAPAAAGGGEGIATASSAPVTIVADKDTNAIIIQTASWYYPVVEATIRRLDVMPKQVLIEVLIAEISLDDDNQFGLQWALKGQGTVDALGGTHALATTAQNVYGSSLGLVSPGFSMMVTEAGRITGVINAYAKDSRLNILSAPHIFATDNKEAKIDIGQEVPILKTRTTGTAGTDSTGSNTTVTNDIEYRSTGVILTVTPHINEGGFVTLDLQQEVSEAQTNTLGGTDSPIIRKRTAKTTMVVKDDQTLVIGGMIQRKQDKSREGIPVLSRLPILGYLFGATTAKVSKTELVLLITPRVVKDADEADQVTREVQNRTLTLKKGIEGFRRDTR